MIGTSNPKAQYSAHREEILAAITNVLESGRYILGDQVRQFEGAFAAYCGAAEAVGVASGTDALVLALKALALKPGDEVITVSHTAVATAAAIELAGGIPVFVDIDPVFFTLDPARLDAALTKKTRAIVPVHLYGQPADMVAIMDFASRNDLRVIEDCAQATGAALGGRKLGTWGDAGCFSFYPTKNLGALGDGGMVVTRDRALAERVTRLREYGWDEKRNSRYSGQSSRLDEIQAAILNVKLAYLDDDNAHRRRIAEIYHRLLAGGRIGLPRERADARHVYHLYVATCEKRAELIAFLKDRGIELGIHYPVPVHRQAAYAAYHSSDCLPYTDAAAAKIISLPIYPELSDADVAIVAEAIRSWEKTS